MRKNQLIGSNPIIGIRPTIDGRRGRLGVRESLEEQTMGMARRALVKQIYIHFVLARRSGSNRRFDGGRAFFGSFDRISHHTTQFLLLILIHYCYYITKKRGCQWRHLYF